MQEIPINFCLEIVSQFEYLVDEKSMKIKNKNLIIKFKVLFMSLTSAQKHTISDAHVISKG